MNPLRLGIILFSVATMLSACGGGGGGGGRLSEGSGSGMMDQTPPPTSDPPTYSTLASELPGILSASDSLLVTDLLVEHPTLGETRAESSCTAGQCRSSYSGYVVIDLSVQEEITFPPDPPEDDYRFSIGSGDVKMVNSEFPLVLEDGGGIEVDFKSLGGWLDHSSFAAETHRITKGVSNGVNLEETIIGWAYSFGQATGTTPAFGNATWTGTMVGSDTSPTDYRGNRIQGDATLTFNLSRSDLAVDFSNIRDIDTAGRSYEDIAWQNIPVTSGSFATGSDESSIEGRFYGQEHEEVGGIFERNEIVGAFGAKR